MNIPIAIHFAEKEMRTKMPVIEATEKFKYLDMITYKEVYYNITYIMFS